MKIGVIADTHLNEPTTALREAVRTYFRDADTILHAGDLHSLRVLEVFGDRKVYAVAGNRDDVETKAILPRTASITAGGFRIGLIHGWGSPFRLGERAAGVFAGLDCLVFGHSHMPVNRLRGDVLLFNPGAFKRALLSLGRRSIGVLTVGKGLEGEIIRL